MRAILECNQWIWFDNITQSEEDILWEEFSVSKPNTYIDSSQMNMWDGVYRKYNRAKQRMARPLLSMLRAVCKKHNLPLEIVDRRKPWEYSALDPGAIGKDFLPGIMMDDHQIRAIQQACKIECGIIDIPTGGGKGEIISGVCKAIDCPTVVIADQRVVIDQLKARLELRDIDSDIGIFYGGKRPSGQTIVVGSIQSLQSPGKIPDLPIKKSGESDEEFAKRSKKWDAMYQAYKTRQKNAKYLQGYVRRAEMLIVDECVHEDTFINVEHGIMTAGKLFSEIQVGDSRNVSVGGKNYIVLGASEKFDDSIKVETDRGRSLITSYNHPYATFDNGFRKDVHAKDLLVGSLLLINNSAPDKTEILDYWYFIGLFIGDGHLLNNKQIKFGVRKDFSDWKHYLRIIANLYDAEYSTSINNRGDLVLRLKSRKLVDSIKDLGFEPGRKMGSINPLFPVPNNSAIASILSGLFDAEGSAYKDHVNFDSSDKPLAEYVQILLSCLGIKSSLYIGNRRNNEKHAVGWRVSVTGSDLSKFYNHVGFRFRRKNIPYIEGMEGARYLDHQPYIKKWLKYLPTLKLADILNCHHTKLSPSNSDKVPLKTLIDWQLRINAITDIQLSYEEAKKLYGVSYEKIARHCKVSVCTAFNRIGNNDYSGLGQYISFIRDGLAKQLVDTTLINFAVEPVRNLTKCGMNRLIDFTVDDIASFEANGILVHNCDKATSDPFKKLFRHWFKGRRRYGFSGTPFDVEKPVEGMVMQEHLGSIIAKETRKNLVAIGRIIQCDYIMMAIGPFDGIKNSDAYDIAREEHMVKSVSFHKLIAKICKKYKGDGTLVLVDREPLGHSLVEAINKVGLTAHFIYGKTPKRRRDELLRSFERREFDVLIGGKIINRGLDLAGGCENLIIATGGKLQSEFEQKIGRALRRNSRGKSRVFDFFFRCNKYLYNHSKAHLKIMVSLDYDTKVIFPGGSIDGAKLIERRFQVPRGFFEQAAQKRLFAE